MFVIKRTSFVLGLGVLGFVDVTVDGTSTIAVAVTALFALPFWVVLCFNELGDFSAILYERDRPPFEFPNCMANDDCIA